MIALATAERCIQNSRTTTEVGGISAALLCATSATKIQGGAEKFRDWAQRKTVRASITLFVVDPDTDPDLPSSSILVREFLENLLRQQVNPDNTAAIVRWSHATKLRLDEIASVAHLIL
jgi:hypothetical protein